MIEISFNEFKKNTHHKRVKLICNYRNGKVFETESDKFYANKDYKIKMICMPKFLIGFEGKMYRVDDNNFLWESEFGKTEFEVLNGDKE